MQVHEKVLISVPILTPNGVEGGRLYFIPADLGLCQRFSETQRALLESLTDISEANICPDGVGADTASDAIISEVEQRFTEMLNYICGIETASEAFRRYKPFAVMSNRQFWASSVMTALSTALSTVTANTKRIQKKIRKLR